MATGERIDPARDVWTPLGVVALGLLPFVVFVGTTSTTTVNGEVVRHDELNVAGLALAIGGLALAWRVVRSPGGHRLVRLAIAGAGALLCLVQVPISVGLLFDDHPAVTASPDGGGGLSDADARIARNQIANNDRETAYGTIRLGLLGILTDTRVHIAYADDCHAGESRLAIADLPDYPAFVTPEDVAAIEADYDATYPGGFHVSCTETSTAHYMEELVADVEHDRAMLEIEVDTYLEVHGDVPP
jgi:hypothetical protein